MDGQREQRRLKVPAIGACRAAHGKVRLWRTGEALLAHSSGGQSQSKLQLPAPRQRRVLFGSLPCDNAMPPLRRRTHARCAGPASHAATPSPPPPPQQGHTMLTSLDGDGHVLLGCGRAQRNRVARCMRA